MTKPSFTMQRARRFALAVGLLSLAVTALGAFVDVRQFAFSYLFAFVFWLGLPLGSLCVLMIHHLTGGGWGYVIRRFLEAGMSTLPWMALLFLPILLALRQLYPWMDPAIVAESPAMQKVQSYLNAPAFVLRALVFFGLWIGASHYLRGLSVRQDQTSDPSSTRQARAFSAPGLLFFTLTVSLALVDWVMVLERNWYSTVFPAQVIVGQILLTFAFCTVALGLKTGPPPFERREEPLGVVVRVEHFHSLGNFLLAFVMLWAYLTVSQLIIVWSGNEPREITWYLHRIAGGWRYVGIALGLFYFALPFCLLLSRENKKSVRFLCGLGAGIFLMHALEVWWQIAPALHQHGLPVPWMDATAFLGVGGLWMTAFLTHIARDPTLPRNDPRMLAALAHGH